MVPVLATTTSFQLSKSQTASIGNASFSSNNALPLSCSCCLLPLFIISAWVLQKASNWLSIFCDCSIALSSCTRWWKLLKRLVPSQLHPPYLQCPLLFAVYFPMSRSCPFFLVPLFSAPVLLFIFPGSASDLASASSPLSFPLTQRLSA